MRSFNLEAVLHHPATTALVRWLVPHRLAINLVLHGLLFAAGYGYSIVLLNGLTVDRTAVEIFSATLAPLLVLRLGVFYWHDLFQGLWRYVSFEDLINILRASVISSLLFYGVGMAWPAFAVSEELYMLDLTFCILLCGGTRSLVRHFRERYFRVRLPAGRKQVLLIGPLPKIHPLLKEMVGDPLGHHRPLAVVDPEAGEQAGTRRLSDVPVLTVAQLLRRSHRFVSADALVICWPGSTRRQMDQLVERLQPLKLPFQTVPHLDELLDGRVSISDIREVEIADLLERPPVQIDMGGIRALLEGKTILVTGGGGSIGSEICRQVAGFRPRRLVVVERCENSLYELLVEFARRFPDTPLSASVSSVNDATGIAALMREHQVEVVFHAAAYKHVPLMEIVPVESAYNNIEGTCNTALAAMAAGVRRFVMISTDKAVNPTNVMGVTKRIAEMVVQGMAGRGETRFMTVRFGNVLGSAGSVIPIFKKQIQAGGPLTVTHPEIERYFMTIPEAVQLVLQAGCMGHGGEIFVLDMGQPVKILKLAEKLIALSGKRPYEEIEIRFTGLRPGEKMYEELFNVGEQLIATEHPRIHVARSTMVDAAFIQSRVARIRSLVRTRDAQGLRRLFLELVPGYRCADLAASEARGSCLAPLEAPADAERPVSSALGLEPN